MDEEFIEEQPIKVVAAVVTDAHRRVLLVRKTGSQHFIQPGGKPEPGEYPLDTLARELEEELGCSIDRESAEHFGSCTSPAANEIGQTVEAELYRVCLFGDISASSEIAEYKWVAPHNPDKLSLAPLTQKHVLPRFLPARR